jgi:hypothetical protein
MLQRADITGARPVILVEAATPAASLGDAQQEAFDRLSLLQLGKQFQAQVLSRLTDGSHLVKIDDAVAGMKLPPGTQTGDVVELTLLATEPRPTFLLGKPSDSATSTASLSQAGRFIADMLQLAQEDGAAPTSVVGKTPLVATPDVPTALIARALQQALTFSGLFYESHVAQWANGTRPLAELLNEPPAKLLNPAQAQAATAQPAPQTAQTPAVPPHLTASPAELSKLVANMKEWANGERVPAEVLQQRKAGLSMLQDDGSTPVSRHDATLNAEGAKLLSLQLDTLEQRRIVWHGELFPGQPFEWEISDETPRGNRERETDDAAQSWQSTVRFSLPTLGMVSATVSLTGEHVRVQVRTADEQAAASLRSHGNMLAEALDAAGTKLDALLVRHDG